MVIRRKTAKKDVVVEEPKGFDAYDLRLGDMMRGERATLGKSLLDVEREIRIRASYIAAIENADPEAFDTPGFIPGYVRSYARYLGMDPEDAFNKFCAECGFAVAHGMSAGASSIRKPDAAPKKQTRRDADPLVSPSTPFVPQKEGLLSGIEPGAIGSAFVLVALISAIGYGGWSVLNQIQRVQVTPSENTPNVLTDLDPLDAAIQTSGVVIDDPVQNAGLLAPRIEDGIDRLYRPEALDVPVMVARDAPISTLDPAEVGAFRTEVAGLQTDEPVADTIDSVVASVLERPTPQVVADPKPGVRLVAVRPAWVRVSSVDGSVIFEGILNGGDVYEVPNREQPPVLRAGESGAIYFEVAGQHYGPAGSQGSVTKGLSLTAEALTDTYDVADVTRDQDLERYVAELQTGTAQE